MEYWIEENIQPAIERSRDEIILDVVKPLSLEAKKRGALSWHFLREPDNWKGQGAKGKVNHIRFRVRVRDDEDQNSMADYIKNELDVFQAKGLILDHYLGSHGTPKQWYIGEASDFDENDTNPNGWIFVQKFLEVGSEIAILLIEGRSGKTTLGSQFNFHKIHHCFGNQSAHFPRSVSVPSGLLYPQIPDKD